MQNFEPALKAYSYYLQAHCLNHKLAAQEFLCAYFGHKYCRRSHITSRVDSSMLFLEVLFDTINIKFDIIEVTDYIDSDSEYKTYTLSFSKNFTDSCG